MAKKNNKKISKLDLYKTNNRHDTELKMASRNTVMGDKRTKRNRSRSDQKRKALRDQQY